MRKFKLNLDEMISLLNGEEEIIKKFKKDIYKKCEFCGKEFIAKTRKNQTLCSKKCGALKYQKNNPEKTRETKRNWARKNKK